MWRTRGLILAGVLSSLGAGAASPDLARGVRLVEEGDFEEAIEELDALVRQIKTSPVRGSELTQAYLYLGVAYVGLGHERLARARFLEALSHDKTAAIAEDQSPKVLQLFRQALNELKGGARAGSESGAPEAFLRPPPAQGLLQIAVRPWAEVMLDGANVGLTPFRKIPARPGAHAVKLLHPGFEPWERTVSVKAGEVTRLIIDLSHEGIRRNP